MEGLSKSALELLNVLDYDCQEIGIGYRVIYRPFILYDNIEPQNPSLIEYKTIESLTHCTVGFAWVDRK